jgi:hypothetical protein
MKQMCERRGKMCERGVWTDKRKKIPEFVPGKIGTHVTWKHALWVKSRKRSEGFV